MKKIIRFLVLLAVIVVGFYLIMTLFMIFAVLVAAGGLIWLYLRYFGKNTKAYSTKKGVTIDHVAPAVSDEPYEPVGSSLVSHPKEVYESLKAEVLLESLTSGGEKAPLTVETVEHIA